jgi:hypothetical protein
MKPYQLKSLQNPGVSRMLALFLVNIVIIWMYGWHFQI